MLSTRMMKTYCAVTCCHSCGQSPQRGQTISAQVRWLGQSALCEVKEPGLDVQAHLLILYLDLILLPVFIAIPTLQL